MPATLSNWTLCETGPHAWAEPPNRATADAAHWVAATVPGTAAQALAQAGEWHRHAPRPLHAHDVWYRCTVEGHGDHWLDCDGLATVVELFLDDQPLARSHSMFSPLSVGVNLHGQHTLWLAFRSLDAHLAQLKLPRARWRVAMVPNQALRGVRTTLLGHMPSWCPPIDTVGPWRAIRLQPVTAVRNVHLRAHVTDDGSMGTLEAELTCASDLSHHTLGCGAHSAPWHAKQPGLWHATLQVPHPARWWPHTHGPATLHTVQRRPPGYAAHTGDAGGGASLDGSDAPVELGQVGFRSLAVDRGPDGQGFSLRINGKAVFARGVVFSPPDPLHPGGEALVAERLARLADMGANMVRVAGPFCYESPAFFRACDALGLMVWQDLMLANFDYPLADPAFVMSLQTEVTHLLRPLAASPSLTVVCGGSEVEQQAAMLGLALRADSLHFFRHTLGEWCAHWCPGVVCVPNSPTGGDVPFAVRTGVAHYFGVGAYERPLDDARRAAPCFATECLAFSHVPEPCSLDALGVPAVHHPAWKVGVPRDRHASWDFEDTRDHYLHTVFGLDPAALRRTDAARYLQASRALAAHVMARTLSEWRRPGSPTHGALVFTASDLQPGAGWGLVASDGEPKAAFHGFRQVAQPLALLLSDEGCDGLDIHLVNDTPQAHTLQLQVQVLRQGRVVVAQGSLSLEAPAHGALTASATQVLGRFFDLTYAFRFGPPGHDAVVVSAQPASCTHPALQAVYFPLGPHAPPAPLGLRARTERDEGGWWLVLNTDTLARFVHIDDRVYRPQDNHFHLAPCAEQRVQLRPRGHQASLDACPQGVVTALNASDTVAYRGTP